jgi:hypothetical protein
MTTARPSQEAAMKSVSALNIYYDDNIADRIRNILRFFGRHTEPDILTITRGSKIDQAKLALAFPRCRISHVGDEFEGYQRACEIVVEDFGGCPILIANDSLGRYWKLTLPRRIWFLNAQRKASLAPGHVIVSEVHRGLKDRFPGNTGVELWSSSNLYVTDDPQRLGNALRSAREAARDVPVEFHKAGEPAVEKRFKARGQPTTPDVIDNKLRRIYVEMCLFPRLLESGMKVISASEGRSILNRAHQKFVDD